MRKWIHYFVIIFICNNFIFLIGCSKIRNQIAESPPGLGYHAMAYDSESRRVVLFGGQTGDVTKGNNDCG